MEYSVLDKYMYDNIVYLLYSYLTTYSLWSAMHELSLLLNYQVFR